MSFILRISKNIKGNRTLGLFPRRNLSDVLPSPSLKKYLKVFGLFGVLGSIGSAGYYEFVYKQQLEEIKSEFDKKSKDLGKDVARIQAEMENVRVNFNMFSLAVEKFMENLEKNLTNENFDSIQKFQSMANEHLELEKLKTLHLNTLKNKKVTFNELGDLMKTHPHLDENENKVFMRDMKFALESIKEDFDQIEVNDLTNVVLTTISNLKNIKPLLTSKVANIEKPVEKPVEKQVDVVKELQVKEDTSNSLISAPTVEENAENYSKSLDMKEIEEKIQENLKSITENLRNNLIDYKNDLKLEQKDQLEHLISACYNSFSKSFGAQLDEQISQIELEHQQEKDLYLLEFNCKILEKIEDLGLKYSNLQEKYGLVTKASIYNIELNRLIRLVNQFFVEYTIKSISGSSIYPNGEFTKKINEMLMIIDSIDEENMALSVIKAIPSLAIQNGIFSKEQLKQSFSSVSKTARINVYLEDKEPSLRTYFASWIFSNSIINKTYKLDEIVSKSYEELEKLDVEEMSVIDKLGVIKAAEILVNEKNSIDRAIILINKFKGTSNHPVVKNWLNEASAHEKTVKSLKFLQKALENRMVC